MYVYLEDVFNLILLLLRALSLKYFIEPPERKQKLARQLCILQPLVPVPHKFKIGASRAIDPRRILAADCYDYRGQRLRRIGCRCLIDRRLRLLEGGPDLGLLSAAIRSPYDRR